MNEEIKNLKLKIIETRARISAGREKNVRAAKNLRRELVRKLTMTLKKDKQ